MINIDLDWYYRGMQCIQLENDEVRILILPALGGKIWQVSHKSTGENLLWQNPRIKPRTLPMHASYDDHFFGGWDELFPNDIPETLSGELYPDHGEIWTLPWEWETEIKGNEAIVRLRVQTPISACLLERIIVLQEGAYHFTIKYKIHNLGQKELPYLWKLHVALNGNENSRIDVAAGKAHLEDFGKPRNGKTNIAYSWPTLEDTSGASFDMRRGLSGESGVSEFQYLTELNQGWCAVTDIVKQIGFGLSFDKEVFPSCWLFASYGGWRSLQTIILEPCSGYPISVAEGIQSGTHKVLGPNELIETEVTAVVYTRVSQITSIDRQGKVSGT
jgi:hypothetical protein